MVYESDFYTTRRPYRASPSYSTYTVSKREIPWEKVPFVPRPSLVPEPVTAFGRRKTPAELERERARRPERKSILSPDERAKIKPKTLLDPPKPYLSPRDINREKIFTNLRRQEQSNSVYGDNLDVTLRRLHRVAENPDLPYKRQIVASSDFPPVFY